ncbi:MAG: leucyl aminopeptidase [Pseudomonadota bacterium]
MTQDLRIEFRARALPSSGTLVVLAADGVALGAGGQEVDAAADGLLIAAAQGQGFKGKRGSTLKLVMPRGLEAGAVLMVGLGDPDALGENDWVKLGGSIAGALPSGPASDVTLLAETPAGALSAAQAAQMAMGMRLRAYTFDLYKSKKADDEAPSARTVVIAVDDVAAAEAAWAEMSGITDGVIMARNLVNEPANVLGPEEFATRAAGLSELGVAVSVLDQAAIEALEMRALLGVAQGSVRPPRVVVMEWNGGVEGTASVALVGKGVVFDTGGISIKPAGGMEDMKGDMGGAAAVVGAMHAIAARKAKANVVGIIGLVENMPDGNAQRPGDIVKSKSGQFIEIINTDAEGRLVLGDLLTHIIETKSPSVVIDLATLTGAVIVALGHFYAGMYATKDDTAAKLAAAGEATGDWVWRMPLGPDYDKMIDSKFADFKNTGGGRAGGSITAAQFLKRFVGDNDWVHIDLAGTAMGAPATDISRTFGSGYGVRLLDRFVADNFEG